MESDISAYQFLNPEEDLMYWYQRYDNYMNGLLSRAGVTVQWSSRLVTRFAKIRCPSDKHTVILLSRKLLLTKNQSESPPQSHLFLLAILFDRMVKAYNIFLRNKRHKIHEIESQSIIDQRLEELDPNPDINELFRRFDEQFFAGMLTGNGVKIICGNELVIDYEKGSIYYLCGKLPQLSTRRETVENLLHQMIHCFIYAFNIYPFMQVRRIHGTHFIQLINWINKKAGINLSPFHLYRRSVRCTLITAHRQEKRD